MWLKWGSIPGREPYDGDDNVKPWNMNRFFLRVYKTDQLVCWEQFLSGNHARMILDIRETYGFKSGMQCIKHCGINTHILWVDIQFTELNLYGQTIGWGHSWEFSVVKSLHYG